MKDHLAPCHGLARDERIPDVATNHFYSRDLFGRQELEVVQARVAAVVGERAYRGTFFQETLDEV